MSKSTKGNHRINKGFPCWKEILTSISFWDIYWDFGLGPSCYLTDIVHLTALPFYCTWTFSISKRPKVCERNKWCLVLHTHKNIAVVFSTTYWTKVENKIYLTKRCGFCIALRIKKLITNSYRLIHTPIQTKTLNTITVTQGKNNSIHVRKVFNLICTLYYSLRLIFKYQKPRL